MIYLDSSVALAYVFAERRLPHMDNLQAPLVSSRLLQYEVWTRVNARGRSDVVQREAARALLASVDLVELSPTALERALQPFPITLRTLDALHLATVEFLRRSGHPMELASYDTRLVAAAEAMGIEIADL